MQSLWASSAAFGSRMSCTVARDTHLCKACLAFNILLIRSADGETIAQGLIVVLCHPCLVCWAVFQQFDSALESFLFVLSVCFSGVNVLSDEVASRFDLQQICLNCFFFSHRCLELGLFTQQLLLCLSKVHFQLCKALFQLLLFLLQLCHRILIIVLSFQLVIVSCGLP